MKVLNHLKREGERERRERGGITDFSINRGSFWVSVGGL